MALMANIYSHFVLIFSQASYCHHLFMDRTRHSWSPGEREREGGFPSVGREGPYSVADRTKRHGVLLLQMK